MANTSSVTSESYLLFEMFSSPFIKLKEVRRGLFSVEWTLKDQMKKPGTNRETIQLCGSQSARAFNLTCHHKPLNEKTIDHCFTVTVEDESCHSSTAESRVSPMKSREQTHRLLKGRKRSELPAHSKVAKSELIPPVYIWMKHNGSYSGNKLLFKKINLSKINTKKWEAMFFCYTKQPDWLILWMDFGTNTATERHVASGLGKLFYDQKQCDVHFQFNCGQSVGAHVLILSAGSPVFAAMFQSELLEAQTGKVDIVDVEIDVFRQLMICLYTGRAPKLSDKTMTQLLFQAADKYGVETLKNECLDELLSQLGIDNAIEMLVWSHFNSVPKLFEYAMEIFVDNSRTLCYQPEWNDLIENYPDLCLLATQRIVGPPYPTELEHS